MDKLNSEVKSNSLGIDIGGTFIKYAIVDKNLKIVKQWKKETKRFFHKDDFYDYLCENIPKGSFDIVGVSAPGVILQDSTVVSQAADCVKVMYQTNVNQEISKRLNVLTATLNDGKSASYCELRIGNGKNSSSSVYFIIGTGVGGCLCYHNNIIYGEDRIAGEFSTLPIGFSENDSKRFKRLGEYASMTALINMYNDQSDEKITTGEKISLRYKQNEPLAKTVVEQWCKNILLGISMIIMIYNPEIICIGGGISEEDWFIHKIQDMYENSIHIISEPKITTKITRCKYNNHSNLLGAVLFAKDTLMNF